MLDLDDTLLSSSEAKWAHHKHVAHHFYGVTITDDHLREHWGRPLKKMIAAIYQDADDPIRIAERLALTNDEFPKIAFDGSAQAVTALLDAGLDVGIITSAFTEPAYFDLQRLGFPADRLFCILGEDVVEHHKPDPRVFDPAIERLPYSPLPSSVVYVGDLMVDMGAATAAGFDFVAVTSGLVSADEFEAAGAKTIVPGIVDAVEAILAS
jgi:phosphoglycolate phosphatase-like HAD superfamily hydrolase